MSNHPDYSKLHPDLATGTAAQTASASVAAAGGGDGGGDGGGALTVHGHGRFSLQIPPPAKPPQPVARIDYLAKAASAALSQSSKAAAAERVHVSVSLHVTGAENTFPTQPVQAPFAERCTAAAMLAGAFALGIVDIFLAGSRDDGTNVSQVSYTMLLNMITEFQRLIAVVVQAEPQRVQVAAAALINGFDCSFVLVDRLFDELKTFVLNESRTRSEAIADVLPNEGTPLNAMLRIAFILFLRVWTGIRFFYPDKYVSDRATTLQAHMAMLPEECTHAQQFRMQISQRVLQMSFQRFVQKTGNGIQARLKGLNMLVVSNVADIMRYQQVVESWRTRDGSPFISTTWPTLDSPPKLIQELKDIHENFVSVQALIINVCLLIISSMLQDGYTFAEVTTWLTSFRDEANRKFTEWKILFASIAHFFRITGLPDYLDPKVTAKMLKAFNMFDELLAQLAPASTQEISAITDHTKQQAMTHKLAALLSFALDQWLAAKLLRTTLAAACLRALEDDKSSLVLGSFLANWAGGEHVASRSVAEVSAVLLSGRQVDDEEFDSIFPDQLLPLDDDKMITPLRQYVAKVRRSRTAGETATSLYLFLRSGLASLDECAPMDDDSGGGGFAFGGGGGY